jgi:DNA-damage-inducible protein J
MKNSKNTHFLLTFAIQYSIIEIQRSIILIRRVTNMATSIVQFRIDDDLKNQATELYDRLGIDLSTAMRMFLKRSVSVNGIPFSMVLPKEDYSASKALEFMEELNKSASDNGMDKMSLDEINSEISSFRAERRTRG